MVSGFIVQDIGRMEITRDTNTLDLSIDNTYANDSTCPANASTSTITTSNRQYIKPSKEQQSQSQGQQRQQQEQGQQEMNRLSSVPSPKPNQVGTVLLYGIPIVSLYIDSKERLCLAQISNTLLKQFSYNEIHNRRVALGITCVQCTPVQLEILRRAGAMPVSSRRCGMITRREAERLCKSFLGDNAPPRLPEDFAFSVHHKCAWGCRGSFLPSRYNSSRAKCIKCSYCGLFFSPNKFIFHSHRIGPSDKYIQPDAANFNSWRRHMKLSGSPPEEIIHAWEDVKAMFNGGTRKRLLTSEYSRSSFTVSTTSPNVTAGSSTASSSSSSSSSVAAQCTKRSKECSPRRSGLPNVAIEQFPLRPLNVHHHRDNTSTSSAATNLIAAHPVTSTPTDITLPFSRNFMMDYMWHAHAQNKSGNQFNLSNCTLPWIKANTGSLIFGNNSLNVSVTSHDHTPSNSANIESPHQNNTSPSASHERFSSPPQSYPVSVVSSEVKTFSGFYTNSAFKPVIQMNRSSASSYSAATTNLALDTVAAVAVAAAAAATPYDNERKSTLSPTVISSSELIPIIKECFSSDDEMVDIETTEDEVKSFELHQQNQQIKDMKKDDTIRDIRHKVAETIDVNNSSDEFSWKGLLKKEQTTFQMESCHNQTPTSSLLSCSPASSINSEHHAAFQLANKAPSRTPDIVLSVSPGPNCSSSSNMATTDQRPSYSPEQQRNVAAAIASAFSHHCQNTLHQSQQSTPNILSKQYIVAASASPFNRSPSHSPGPSTVSLVSGRLPVDTGNNTSILFGAISSSKNNSPFLNKGNNCSGITNATCTRSNSVNNGNSNGNLTMSNASAAIPSCVNNEFWSVARLSLNRPPNEYNVHHRLPIKAAFHRHHHDITKHFQTFRHHGHETPTHTNGVG